MKSKNRFVVCMAVAALFLTACAQASTADDPLSGTEWELMAYRKTSPIEGTTITASFEDGEIRGSGGCNSYFGSYAIDGNSLSIEGLAWTEMACLNPDGVMQQEQEIMGYLSASEQFELQDGRLIIEVGGHETLTFEPLE